MTTQYPCFIPVRDRLTPLRLLVDWLESVDQNEIYLVDNASTFPPLLDYLSSTRHHVVRVGRNLWHRAPWLTGLVAKVGHDRFFIVSDPDVVPSEKCPTDALDRFRSLFDEHEDIDKVGFGLRIDDLPDSYALKQGVIGWERQFWEHEVAPGVYLADIDTTFALYRPGLRHRNERSLRTGDPYVARHVPWYVDSRQLSDEDRYYRDHADPLVTNWDQDTLSTWKRIALHERES